jgi:hypothetical protein
LVLILGFSLSYLLTSITIFPAAKPTAYKHSAEKAYGNIAPIRREARTIGLVKSTVVTL